MLQDKKIAIVGGGPGGLTLAKLLQLQSANVKVYERDVDRTARVQGSLLDLHDSSGLAALRKAGLIAEFKKNYIPGADKTTITNEQAVIVFTDDETHEEGNFDQEHFRPEIDRGVLRRILIDSLEADTIVWGSQFQSMEKQGEGWLILFQNGKSTYADLVIGSDGANSRIRPYVTEIKAFYTGITMLEGNIYDAEKLAPMMSKLLRNGKVMAFGNEKNILMGKKPDDEIGFYASFKAAENWPITSGLDFSNRSQLLEWFKNKYPEWNSVWSELFETAIMPFIPRPINCMPLDQTWEPLPNVTIIGDAAHLMPPFAGEGVNMAMLDALELSECFLANKHGSLKMIISNYEINMRKRAALVAKKSLDNGEKMHSDIALFTMTEFFRGHS